MGNLFFLSRTRGSHTKLYTNCMVPLCVLKILSDFIVWTKHLLPGELSVFHVSIIKTYVYSPVWTKWKNFLTLLIAFIILLTISKTFEKVQTNFSSWSLFKCLLPVFTLGKLSTSFLKTLVSLYAHFPIIFVAKIRFSSELVPLSSSKPTVVEFFVSIFRFSWSSRHY